MNIIRKTGTLQSVVWLAGGLAILLTLGNPPAANAADDEGPAVVLRLRQVAPRPAPDADEPTPAAPTASKPTVSLSVLSSPWVSSSVGPRVAEAMLPPPAPPTLAVDAAAEMSLPSSGPVSPPVATTAEAMISPAPPTAPADVFTKSPSPPLAPVSPPAPPADIPSQMMAPPPPPSLPTAPTVPSDGPPLAPRDHLRPLPMDMPVPADVVPVEAAAPAPLTYRTRCGLYCDPNCRSGERFTRRSMYPIPWEAFAQGEYVGPARQAHVPEYRLRVDDQLEFVFIFSVRPSSRPYRLSVRDRFRVESFTAPDSVNGEVFVQPDGTITLRLLGQVRVVGMTIDELRSRLDDRYKEFLRNPSISIVPLELNMPLQELRYSVDRRYGAGGQVSLARVTPEGTVQLPVIGSVAVQGLTLGEVKREIEARYEPVAEGIEVTPILSARAPRYCFVVGEVHLPGRFSMEGPTTVLQAIAMAGSWNVGAHLDHVVVLRRDDNWRLMATKLNLHAPLYGKRPCRGDEIWLRDSDIVIVPKSPLLTADDYIDLVFTRGLYRVVPLSLSLNFQRLTTL